MAERLRLAVRTSKLAHAQWQIAARALRQAWPQLKLEQVPIVAEGDRIAGSLAVAGGKELFARALQQALFAGAADAACHSLKDLGRDREDLLLAAFLPRGDPRDALVGATMDELRGMGAPVPARSGPRHAPRVATSSPRRTALLQHLLPPVRIVPLRGNVDTRLKRLDSDAADALILAAAGLDRLQLGGRIAQRLPADSFVPAAGQGTIALECLRGNGRAAKLLAAVDDHSARRAALAERACVARLNGDCHTPLGAHATIGAAGQIRLHCLVAAAQRRASGAACGTDPVQVGRAAADALLADGGAKLLQDNYAAGAMHD